MLEIGNDVGLFAEEYAPSEREFRGNFPQAFTHMALINSAAQLRRAQIGAGHAKPIVERGDLRRSRNFMGETLHHATPAGPRRGARRRHPGGALR